MFAFARHNLIKIALPLLGSAIFICSCTSDIESNIVVEDKTKTPSIKSENLTVVRYENGRMAYKFKTPLLERYEFTDEPYTEFRKGVHLETFNDSTKEKETDLIADYAKYIEKKKLWEAKGNVVATNQDGKTVYTEQMFWDTEADSVYSNVDTKLVDGDDVTLGSGFWSEMKLTELVLTVSRGKTYVDTTRNIAADTTAVRRDSTGTSSPQQ